jgi:hypothetical protein
MVADMRLTSEQLALLTEKHELLNALFELIESDEFKSLFGDMSLDEALRRYETTLQSDGNAAWEHDIEKRYEEYQLHKQDPDYIIDDDDFSKLEAGYKRR